GDVLKSSVSEMRRLPDLFEPRPRCQGAEFGPLHEPPDRDRNYDGDYKYGHHGFFQNGFDAMHEKRDGSIPVLLQGVRCKCAKDLAGTGKCLFTLCETKSQQLVVSLVFVKNRYRDGGDLVPDGYRSCEFHIGKR